MSELRGTAYHEAGHLVASHVLGGRRCILITIVPDEKRDARVQYEPMPDSFQPDIDLGQQTEAIIRTEVVSFFAGASAQERIDGREEATDSSWGDLMKAADLASYVCGSEEQERVYLHECEEEAARTIDTNWSAVEALAEALLEHRTLTGEEAVGIIEGAARKRG